MYYSDFDTWLGVHIVQNKGKTEPVDGGLDRAYLLGLFKDDFRELWDNCQEQIKELETTRAFLANELEIKKEEVNDLRNEIAELENDLATKEA